MLQCKRKPALLELCLWHPTTDLKGGSDELQPLEHRAES